MCATADNMFKHPEKSEKDEKGLTLPAVAQYVAQGLMAVLSPFTIFISHKETPHKSKLQILYSRQLGLQQLHHTRVHQAG